MPESWLYRLKRRLLCPLGFHRVLSTPFVPHGPIGARPVTEEEAHHSLRAFWLCGRCCKRVPYKKRTTGN